ncbi:unnamed protein product [Lactuca virosa]|uniref:Uncharacterized protein n=1 Tax=Lactuca virosa TaxID=75947 RepID=A0AAU9LEL7_9ASTR|nr:unnamed protein product [Lactuca virosa]
MCSLNQNSGIMTFKTFDWLTQSKTTVLSFDPPVPCLIGTLTSQATRREKDVETSLKNTDKEFPLNYCYSTKHTSIFSRRRLRRRGSLIPFSPRLTRSFLIQ